MKTMYALPALACFAALLIQSAVEAFDPISLTIGATTLALTGTQVALGVAGIAGLAIVKEKLIFAGLSRNRNNRRGRRAVIEEDLATETIDLGPFFNAVAAVDASDCGKMLVCHVMAKPEELRSADEKRVAGLFDDLSHVDAASSYANYQLAAMVGNLKRTDLCNERYARCPVGYQALEEILDAHSEV